MDSVDTEEEKVIETADAEGTPGVTDGAQSNATPEISSDSSELTQEGENGNEEPYFQEGGIAKEDVYDDYFFQLVSFLKYPKFRYNFNFLCHFAQPSSLTINLSEKNC